MSKVAWPDLGQYGMRLRLRQTEGGNRLVMQGAVEAYAEELAEAGFRREAGEPGWSAPAAGKVSALRERLQERFPKVGTEVLDAREIYGSADPVVAVVPASPGRSRRPQPPDDGQDARQVTYTKVGEHRGAKRLWLEGLRLKAAGFDAHTPYQVIYDRDARTITLRTCADGDRTVSGRRRKGQADPTPIIDLASAEVGDVLADAGRVRAVISDGCIVFSLHHQDVARVEREARLRDEVRAGELSEGTLCAGGGVSTLAIAEGFEAAGLGSRVEWIVDRERRYLEVADTNNKAISPATRMFEAALEELEPVLLPKVSVMSVSLPCTGHSVAGKAKRKLKHAEQHPTDSLAVVGLVRILDAVNPSVVISENVTNARESATYDLVRAYLQDSGYVLFERNLGGEDAGSLEDRKRWWLVAISSGLAEGFDMDSLPAQVRQYRRLGDALEALPADDARWGHNAYLDAKEKRDKAAGKGFRRQFVDESSTTVPTVRRSYLKRGSSDPFVRRSDGMERLLTPREHARVKGVDERLVEGTSLQTAHEVLGQSVLGGHGRAIGEAIGRHLQDDDNDDGPAPSKVRGPGV